MSWPYFMNPVLVLAAALGLAVHVAIGIGALVQWRRSRHLTRLDRLRRLGI